jgi:hypothetical protein
MCSTSVPATHMFMKLQFDSLEPRFALFANGIIKLLKASLLLHQHKRKRYKRFVSKPSTLHLFLMVMAFPLILLPYANQLSTAKLKRGHRMRSNGRIDSTSPTIHYAFIPSLLPYVPSSHYIHTHYGRDHHKRSFASDRPFGLV